MMAANSGVLGPETRTIPTPPRPGGGAAATMGSARVTARMVLALKPPFTLCVDPTALSAQAAATLRSNMCHAPRSSVPSLILLRRRGRNPANDVPLLGDRQT